MKSRFFSSILLLIACSFIVLFTVFFTSRSVSSTYSINELQFERDHNGYFLRIDNRELPLTYKQYQHIIKENSHFYKITYSYNIFSGKRGSIETFHAIGDVEG